MAFMSLLSCARRSKQNRAPTHHTRPRQFRLRRELQGHLWITETDCFFGQFFPLPADDIPMPPSFSEKPTEGAVVRWFSKYCAACTDAGALPNCPWVWATSPNRPLIHLDTTQKLDFFLYPKAPTNAALSDVGGPGGRPRKSKKPGQEYAWSEVTIVSELKCKKGLDDLSSEVVIQTASYVRELIFTQPGRRFAHAFSVVNSHMRCWASSSQNAAVSPSKMLQVGASLC